jgi:hypothetical protein
MISQTLLPRGFRGDRKHRSDHWPVRGMRSLGPFLLLAGLWGAPSAYADAIGSGVQAYAHQDYARSARILMPSAERGQSTAQTYLGYMYANGRGVPQDFSAAVKWLRRAANQGAPAAQFLLGLMYDNGRGVTQDFVEAEVWLNLAAAKADLDQRDYWTRIRNAVATKLTMDELAQAQKRALEWTPIREQ